MQHPDEGTIHAWLDGALDDGERVAVEQHVASCAECAARVADARGMIAGASRIVGALDVTPATVIPKRAGAAQPSSLWRVLRVTPARAALAASLLVAASLVLAKRHDTPNKLVPRAPIAVATTDSSTVAPAPAVAAPAAAAPKPAAKRVQRALPERDTTPPTVAAALPSAAASSSLNNPRARLGYSVTRMSELAADRSAPGMNPFVGCYQLGSESAQELASLPARFALELSAESGGGNRNVVRAVTPEGRVDSVLAGSSWRITAPMLSNVNLTSPNGPRHLNVSLAPGGSVIASVMTDSTPHRITLSRIDCRP
jgi:hypothetical protein